MFLQAFVSTGHLLAATFLSVGGFAPLTGPVHTLAHLLIRAQCLASFAAVERPLKARIKANHQTRSGWVCVRKQAFQCRAKFRIVCFVTPLNEVDTVIMTY